MCFAFYWVFICISVRVDCCGLHAATFVSSFSKPRNGSEPYEPPPSLSPLRFVLIALCATGFPMCNPLCVCGSVIASHDGCGHRTRFHLTVSHPHSHYVRSGDRSGGGDGRCDDQ